MGKAGSHRLVSCQGEPASSLYSLFVRYKTKGAQELSLQTVTPVGPSLAVDLLQKKEPFPLSESPIVSLDEDLSVEADSVPTHSTTIRQDTLTVEEGLAPTQREVPRGTSLQREKNEGTAIGGGLVPVQNEEIQDLSLDVKNPILVPDDRLGAVLEGKGTEIRGHIRLIRLKHSLSDWWQDPTAIPSFAKWLDEKY